MKEFNSKIILFGEYAVLNGSKLLAIPFDKFHGKLVLPENKYSLSEYIKLSNKNLFKLYNYLNNNQFLNFNINNFKQELNKGLYFDSNIPQGYGVGSSGALVAAIFDRYFCSQELFTSKWPYSTNELQKKLAQIESFFHGSSSGADPLVSYLNKPVLINGDTIEHFNFPVDQYIFLIDSKQIGKTEGLINSYNDKSSYVKDEFVLETNSIIESYLNLSNNLFESIRKYSLLEKKLFPKMFAHVSGLSSIEKQYNNSLIIKLCGSGGGGFLLAFCLKKNLTAIKESFKQQNIPILLL